MGKCIDIIGHTFGLLTIEKFCGSKFIRGKQRRQYLGICECGGTKIVECYQVRKGLCKSCGCLRKRLGANNPKWTGYGEISGNNWDYIKYRCNRSWRGKRNKKIPFKITIKQAWDLFIEQDKKCALTGLELYFGKEKTASLDRIDSNEGYVLGNIQWVHKHINLMKQCFSQNDFINYCRLVAKCHQVNS